MSNDEMLHDWTAKFESQAGIERRTRAEFAVFVLRKVR